MSGEAFKLGVRPIEVVDKLPTPEEVFGVPKITTSNLITKVLGPAMIALGAAIGSGEWLMGPSVAALYGLGLFWLVIIGCFLQTVFNISFCRVTLATGEPAIVYFTRVKPGPILWGWIILIVVWGQLVWPGWASAAATGLGSIILGRIPTAADATFVRLLGIVLFIICLIICMVGYKIERTLEIVMWAMMIFVFVSLLFIIAPLCVTGEAISEMGRGIVSFGYIPKGVDIFLLAGWWAYIAYATGNNFVMSNFYRDKGYGMSYLVGYIPAVIGGKKVPVSPVGKTFNISPENLATWRRWMRLLRYDQWGIFFVGGVIGMFLPSLIVRSLVPVGTKLPAWGIAAHVATQFAAKVGPWGFYYICLIGFLILFSTQLQVVDVLMRNTVDLAWSVSEAVRRIAKGDIRVLYYSLFIVYIIWACIAFWLEQPLVLLLLGANAANLGGVFSVPLTMYMNRQLPKELRPAAWEYVILVIFWFSCIFFFTAMILGQVFGIKIF